MSRLDDSVSIETYELEFRPDLKAHTFRGRGKYSVTTTAAHHGCLAHRSAETRVVGVTRWWSVHAPVRML